MFEILEQAAQLTHAPHESIEAQCRLLRFAIRFRGTGHLIPSAPLREIQRAIGSGEYRLEITLARLHRRDTDRQRDADRAFTALTDGETV